MIANAKYQDTPSIIQRTITTARPGQSLRYDQLTALEKRDHLFDQGIRPTAYENYKDEARPDVVLGLVQFGKSALESISKGLLGQTLTRDSDELEVPKPKLFHTYGTTAKVVFAPQQGTRYTGLFSQKAHGLARFSYAGPVSGIGVVPGLGFKFPIDGERSSENMVAMRMLDRQQSAMHLFSTHSQNSVFQNIFTNILPLPSFLNVTMRIVKERFETVVTDGRGLHQPVDNLARVLPNGQAIPPEQVLAPYRVMFRPTSEARRLSDPTIDFRDDLARNIPQGTAIYDVLALDEREEIALGEQGVTSVEDLADKAALIGTLVTESEFIASKYGDYRLFLKHNATFLRPELQSKEKQPVEQPA
jgi:hypothetical protein